MKEIAFATLKIIYITTILRTSSQRYWQDFQGEASAACAIRVDLLNIQQCFIS